MVGQTFLSVPDRKVRTTRSERTLPDPRLRITRRRLPHWRFPGATYFVTFRLQSGKLSAEERRLVLQHIRSGDPRFYELRAVQVMPDHVHMLLYPGPARSLTQVMKGIKGVTARKLNEKRGTKGHVWQDEYYDRIMRDNDEFVEKLQYMLHNPLKYGLIDDPLQYDGWYMKEVADRNVCPTNRGE